MKHFSGDISIVLGGAAGQGIQTVEAMLVSVLKAEGYRIFACKEYMSRIRGGSNSTEIRIGRHEPKAYVHRIDFLLALDKAVIEHLAARISRHTILLGEKEKIARDDIHVIDVPFTRLSSELGNPVFASTIAVGAVLGMLGAERGPFEEYLRGHFARKGEDIVAKNLEAAARGMDLGKHIAFMEGFEVTLKKDESVCEELLLDGNTALGLGALAAGCNFISSYPMSPGTGVLTFLAGKSREFGVVIDQAEDEIAAINMAIGAWYAGARALVTTSGGGFALMCEGVSLSGMIETPVVVHIGQRPGPATGLPTRTEQADLNLVLYAGHGEFPRAIFAPGTPEQAFHAMQQAFETADTFQVPVFVLSDQYSLDSLSTIPKEKLELLPIINHVVETQADYRRYVITEDGVSPRGVPGFGLGLVGVDSDEHDESAHITESATVRIAMHEKRLRKLTLLQERALMPESIEAVKGARTLVVTWGSNYGVLEEALAHIKDSSIAGLHFSQVYPLNPAVKKIFTRKKIVVMENNAIGQFANLLEQELGIEVSERILKYNGTPFSVEETIENIKKSERLKYKGMIDKKLYDMPHGTDNAWCPACGNFPILTIVKTALAELGKVPEEVVITSGIGQAAKTPHYLRVNYFNGLHGRALAPAIATKIASPKLTVIAESGDGDTYGEGGNHFLHTIRRNPDITNIVHNNMIYGLTKGQASPTSEQGLVTPLQPGGVIVEPFNPIAVAISLGATFVARAYAGNIPQAVAIVKQAIEHKGYALVDIFQPCVVFNKQNTYQWFMEHTYLLDEAHDATDQAAAWKIGMDQERLALGIIYRETGRPTYESLVREGDDMLLHRNRDDGKVRALVDSYVKK